MYVHVDMTFDPTNYLQWSATAHLHQSTMEWFGGGGGGGGGEPDLETSSAPVYTIKWDRSRPDWFSTALNHGQNLFTHAEVGFKIISCITVAMFFSD